MKTLSNKTKRRLLLIALMVLLAAGGVAGTYAALTANATSTNIVKTGALTVKGEFFTLENGKEVPYTGEMTADIMPTQTVSRIMRIHNTGTENEYVRVVVTPSVGAAPWTSTGTGLDKSLFEIQYNKSDWTASAGKNASGETVVWYYYNKVLAPGKSTEPLFTGVNFNYKIDNKYIGTELTINTNVQGVQSAHNAPASGKAVDVTGWPAA